VTGALAAVATVGLATETPGRKVMFAAHPLHVARDLHRCELAHRRSSGIDVRLLWNPLTDSLVVDVHDIAGRAFRLAPSPDRALDAFNHPFAQPGAVNAGDAAEEES
jgi:hypothetical protein